MISADEELRREMLRLHDLLLSAEDSDFVRLIEPEDTRALAGAIRAFNDKLAEARRGSEVSQ